jgi:ABC-type antimicrobial peptide transport system permease subunit
MIRTGGDPLALARAARDAVAGIDPNVPVSDMRTWEDVVARSVAQPRLLMMLLAAFGAVSLLMATLGIYGVVTYSVGQRTREFGIRLALGARPTNPLRQVLGSGARLSAVGLLIGLAGAWIVTRYLGSELYETQMHDPVIFAAMAILLGLVALAGAYLPARRAARMDPTSSLGEE